MHARREGSTLMRRGVAYKALNQQISIRIDKTKEWTDYLSNKCLKLDIILMTCACGFGLCPLSAVILCRLLSFGGTLACAVRCPE